MNPFIQSNLSEMRKLFQHYHVKRAYLFGSMVLDNNLHSASDVDLMIKMDEELEPAQSGGYYLALWDELESLLHKKVDIITEGKQKNKIFLEEVNKNKVLIYGE
jgi:predicted nucleotidyltransferase